MENAEEVLGVLVDLRPLALREDVLEVERMPAEPLGELRPPRRPWGVVEVNPGQSTVRELEKGAAGA